LDQGWQAQGLSLEQRARQASELRHGMRMTARAMMSDPAQVLGLLLRDAQKYGDGEGPTFDQLVAQRGADGLEGDAIYQAILGSSQRTDRGTSQRVSRGETGMPTASIPEGVTIRGDVATVRDANGAEVVIRIRREPGDGPPHSVRNPDGSYEIR